MGTEPSHLAPPLKDHDPIRPRPYRNSSGSRSAPLEFVLSLTTPLGLTFPPRRPRPQGPLPASPTPLERPPPTGHTHYAPHRFWVPPLRLALSTPDPKGREGVSLSFAHGVPGAAGEAPTGSLARRGMAAAVT